MIYTAQVIKLSDEIEEDVVIRVNDVELNCFASVCPYPIEEGKSYPVQLELVVLDDYEVVESSRDDAPNFTRTGQGFAYLVKGKINGMHLEAGSLIFEDKVMQADFGYLDGKIVTIRVDRINVEFLSR